MGLGVVYQRRPREKRQTGGVKKPACGGPAGGVLSQPGNRGSFPARRRHVFRLFCQGRCFCIHFNAFLSYRPAWNIAYYISIEFGLHHFVMTIYQCSSHGNDC